MESDQLQELEKIHPDHLVKVGITHGDINSISYEIIIKTFSDQRIAESFTPILYGQSKVASYYRKMFNFNELTFNLIKKADTALPRRINIINCYEQEVKIEPGHSTETGGELAYLSLKMATEDLIKNQIDVLVTAPINKHNIQSKEFQFPGHTEYLASRFNAHSYLMMMVDQQLRIGIMTGHLPIREVAASLTREMVLLKIRILYDSLVRDFGIRNPRIAVLGLNPHAGDQGLLGTEDEQIILLAIREMQEKQMLVFGPFSADGFFGTYNHRHFDGVLAAYHDQGMIPFKTLAMETGVNYTAGLPFVRTSPAHGTAYDIAGKNEASPDSFRQALYLAVDIFNKRREYSEITSNPLQKAAHPEDVSEQEQEEIH
ncbi:MAG TPA: 4-hydroxythreonine-4-phosphate dehydrogenase PdxA [Bacteroidales bacterium]|nr:4-hydroxythreonine-4-phosphate dehydrogenase PdxA [Bacteroidales bacterium]